MFSFKAFPDNLGFKPSDFPTFQSLVWICNLLAIVAAFHLTNSILLWWAERIREPAMETERYR